MKEYITLTIDGKSVKIEKGSTLLEAARKAGADIPTLCHDERVKPYGACGMCVVECKGSPKLMRSCAIEAADGMAFITKSAPRSASLRSSTPRYLLTDARFSFIFLLSAVTIRQDSSSLSGSMSYSAISHSRKAGVSIISPRTFFANTVLPAPIKVTFIKDLFSVVFYPFLL